MLTRTYLDIISKRWLLLILPIILLLSIAILYSNYSPDFYEARASLLLQNMAKDRNILFNASDFANIAKSSKITQEVIRKSDLKINNLQDNLIIYPRSNYYIELGYKSTDYSHATSFISSLVEETINYINRNNIEIMCKYIDKPRVVSSNIRQRFVFNVFMAIFWGLILGVGLVILTEHGKRQES